MEKEYVKNTNHGGNIREKNGDDNLLRSSSSDPAKQTSTSDFVLQWGNRKRLRCMKVKDDSTTPLHKTTVRVDRRVMRSEKDHSHANNGGYLNLRHRSSPPPPPPPQRVLRNSDSSIAMRGQSNGGGRRISSPEKGAQDKKGVVITNNNNYNHKPNHINEHNNKSAASSDTAHDSKKGGGSSSGSGDAAAAAAAALPVWPPKFVIGLTNREKEEDFLAIKGSKLPQRPKKRAKFIQRTLNLVSPGSWLADLTLDRYEVREKKITKKRPRGLKAMGNMDSDSE